ncbi:MAG: amidohydrolase family protein [Thermofilaceae archaeon]|nr:amidohydrolase family protein [Thermofilaceae archaeon]MCX8180010.1 amidohydrolase family protein [Thermofilaceae archaeon]MDW8003247.1 amidohydrolase family protein [Thermofilaceae archaeon]
MEVEVGTLITPYGVRHNAKLQLEGEGSLYVETAIVPGFSDAHAHPQVVDVGEGLWNDAYEWIAKRTLKVDEVALRADLEFSSKLAAAVMVKGLLEGVTMMALVGRGEANVLAYRRLPAKPRLVILPTILDSRAGWLNSWNALNLAISLSSLDGAVPVGLFAHSLGHVTPASLKAAYRATRELNIPFGLHLSEGIDELSKLVSFLDLKEGDDSRIVAVHCISGSGYKNYGIRVVHCPLSNLKLFGRTLSNVKEVDALGSDWPLLLGSVLSTYRAAVKLHGMEHALYLLDRATAGGYRIYGLDWRGDVVAFDEPLEKVIEGESTPVFVAVKGKLLVKERVVTDLSLNSTEIDKTIAKLLRFAKDAYPAKEG